MILAHPEDVLSIIVGIISRVDLIIRRYFSIKSVGNLYLSWFGRFNVFNFPVILIDAE